MNGTERSSGGQNVACCDSVLLAREHIAATLPSEALVRQGILKG